MARIAGINIPMNKHVWVGLTHIYGIGNTQAKKACAAAGVKPTTLVKDLTEAEVAALRSQVGKLTVEGDLRRLHLRIQLQRGLKIGNSIRRAATLDEQLSEVIVGIGCTVYGRQVSQSSLILSHFHEYRRRVVAEQRLIGLKHDGLLDDLHRLVHLPLPSQA